MRFLDGYDSLHNLNAKGTFPGINLIIYRILLGFIDIYKSGKVPCPEHAANIMIKNPNGGEEPLDLVIIDLPPVHNEAVFIRSTLSFSFFESASFCLSILTSIVIVADVCHIRHTIYTECTQHRVLRRLQSVQLQTSTQKSGPFVGWNLPTWICFCIVKKDLNPNC